MCHCIQFSYWVIQLVQTRITIAQWNSLIGASQTWTRTRSSRIRPPFLPNPDRIWQAKRPGCNSLIGGAGHAFQHSVPGDRTVQPGRSGRGHRTGAFLCLTERFASLAVPPKRITLRLDALVPPGHAAAMLMHDGGVSGEVLR